MLILSMQASAHSLLSFMSIISYVSLLSYPQFTHKSHFFSIKRSISTSVVAPGILSALVQSLKMLYTPQVVSSCTGIRGMWGPRFCLINNFWNQWNYLQYAKLSMRFRQGLLQKWIAGIIVQVQPILAQLEQLMVSQAQPIAMTLSFVNMIYINV